MRKIYIALLSLFTLFFFSTKSSGQVSTYIFSQTSGAYTPITGGTVVATATANAGAAALDDVNFTLPAATIPFTFTFNGIGYTGLNINSNGYITFGATLPPGGFPYTPLSDPTAYAGAIAAFGGDNIGVFNIASATAEIRYEIVGVAPNREFVIQWKNFRPTFATTTASAFVLDFQVRLGENNFIKVVYGGTLGYLIGSTPYNGTKQIGLRGATAADFNNRLNAAGVAFGSSIAGTANTSAQNFNTTTNPPGMPASGLTYTWFVPPPCVAGSMAGGVTQSTLSSACVGVPFSLSVTGASFGTGLTYQWESSTTGVFPGTTIGGATAATYLVPTQSTATYYRRKMTCSGTDAFSTPVLVGQNSASSCYCPVTFTSNVEPITLVNMATINNATSATLNGTPPLEDFSAIVANVSKGQSYPIRVKGNTDGNFTTRIDVYIDFNQDGDFIDPGENFFIGTIVNSTGVDAIEATGNIAIPPTALDGNARMRVMKKFNTSATPCNTDGYGQAEDYTLNISTPLCIAPSAVSVGTITANSAIVTFTSGGGTAYVEYGLAGFTPGAGAAAGAGGTVITPATSPQLIAGLAANTLYTAYVRRDCGAGVFSSNTSAGNFRTLCGAISTFPYTETFEASDPTRPCWKVNEYVVGVVDWIYATGGNGGAITTAHGGTLNARFYQGNYNGNTTKLVSPSLNLSSMTNGAVVRFWFAQEVWAGDQDQMRVYYKTSAAGPWTLIPGAVYTASVGQWTEVELTLPASTTAPDYYVAFEGFANFGRGVLIDDVTIEAAPSCPKPTAVSAVAITSTAVTVSFTSPGTGFIVEYGAPGFVPGTTNTAGVGGTVVFGPGSPITVGPPSNTLAPNTAYDFYVRRICIPGVDFSVNVKVTATTLCSAVNVPYTQDFNAAVIPAPPTCTSIQDLNGSPTWQTVAPPPVAWGFPGNALRYLYDVSKPANDWFFIQGLNLTGGTTYQLSYKYGATDPLYPEKMKVAYGATASAAGMVNVLIDYPSIVANGAAPFAKTEKLGFTPAVTGVYYIGFQVYSDADEFQLYLDSINVKIAPILDVGVTGIVTPALTCPTNNVFIQANIKNYNITTADFSLHPDTVRAVITGAGTATLSAVLNTGTLAPGASMGIYLSPAFNFSSGGVYNIKVYTKSLEDLETANDTLTTSIVVNANPPAPVITPSSAQLCIGSSVQLNTQFTPPAPPVTLPAVSSGTITVAIPDNLPAGATHTIAVSSIPAGASLTGISVTIDKIAHTYDGDLIINLRSPDNKFLNLFNQRGLGGDSIISMVINSTSANSLVGGVPPFTNTFAPDAIAANPPTGFDQNVTSFAGMYGGGNGNWTLAVRDNAGLDVGILRGWSITFTYQFVNPVVTWSPLTGLFTNATATTAYTGGDAFSVYVKPPATGTFTYTATATSAAGCTTSGTATVTVNPIPVVTIGSIPDTVCLSDQLVPLVASPAGGSWSGIGVSGSNFVPPATAVGTYTLTYSYSSALGCGTTGTKRIVVKDCPERIIELSDNALYLYPNPNNGQFNIRINSVLYNYLGMKVFANNGILVKSQVLSGLAYGRVIPIDLTNLPGGVYMVKFYYDGGVRASEKTFKIIIGNP
jgi:subtilisin-like proprotein convertase family protein